LERGIMKRNTWIGLGIGLALVAGVSAYVWTRPKDEVKWRKGKLDRGNITQRINATGAVSPVVQVAVGTQVSGVIQALYVDYNSIVKKGQLVAQIDPTVWVSQLQDAQASLLRAQAAYDFAKIDHERSKRLSAEKLLADQDLDTKATALKNAQGNLESAKATLDRAKANLGYCNITAPVDGVVISRLADVGQTVAASFSTPSLYMIAQDLSKMKVQVSIGESDIDDVKVGQRAFFNVDSLPDKQFAATVSLVRQEPVTTNNVVTYVVEMIVPNEPLPGAEGEDGHPSPRMKPSKEHQVSQRVEPLAGARALSTQELARIPGGASELPGPKFTGNLALRPGMTANVTITTNQHRDVLRVPNSSLRFNPAAFIKDEKKADGPKLGQPVMFGGPRPAGGAQSGTGTKGGVVAKREDRIWVLENGKPKAMVVKAGISDGQLTEVAGEGLQEGLEVLVGVESAKQVGGSPAPLTGSPGGRR
jgi:RND family efflux transporter MFP subunit